MDLQPRFDFTYVHADFSFYETHANEFEQPSAEWTDWISASAAFSTSGILDGRIPCIDFAMLFRVCERVCWTAGSHLQAHAHQ